MNDKTTPDIAAQDAASKAYKRKMSPGSGLRDKTDLDDLLVLSQFISENEFMRNSDGTLALNKDGYNITGEYQCRASAAYFAIARTITGVDNNPVIFDEDGNAKTLKYKDALKDGLAPLIEAKNADKPAYFTAKRLVITEKELAPGDEDKYPGEHVKKINGKHYYVTQHEEDVTYSLEYEGANLHLVPIEPKDKDPRAVELVTNNVTESMSGSLGLDGKYTNLKTSGFDEFDMWQSVATRCHHTKLDENGIAKQLEIDGELVVYDEYDTESTPLTSEPGGPTRDIIKNVRPSNDPGSVAYDMETEQNDNPYQVPLWELSHTKSIEVQTIDPTTGQPKTELKTIRVPQIESAFNVVYMREFHDRNHIGKSSNFNDLASFEFDLDGDNELSISSTEQVTNQYRVEHLGRDGSAHDFDDPAFKDMKKDYRVGSPYDFDFNFDFGQSGTVYNWESEMQKTIQEFDRYNKELFNFGGVPGFGGGHFGGFNTGFTGMNPDFNNDGKVTFWENLGGSLLSGLSSGIGRGFPYV